MSSTKRNPDTIRLGIEVRMAIAEKRRQRAIDDMIAYTKDCLARIQDYNRRIAGYKAALTTLKAGPRERAPRKTRSIELQ